MLGHPLKDFVSKEVMQQPDSLPSPAAVPAHSTCYCLSFRYSYILWTQSPLHSLHYQPSLGSLFLLLVGLSLCGPSHGSRCHIFHHSLPAAALSNLSTIQCRHISLQTCYRHCHGQAGSPHCSKVSLRLQLSAQIILQKDALPVNLKSSAKGCFLRCVVYVSFPLSALKKSWTLHTFCRASPTDHPHQQLSAPSL